MPNLNTYGAVTDQTTTMHNLNTYGATTERIVGFQICTYS